MMLRDVFRSSCGPVINPFATDEQPRRNPTQRLVVMTPPWDQQTAVSVDEPVPEQAQELQLGQHYDDGDVSLTVPIPDLPSEQPAISTNASKPLVQTLFLSDAGITPKPFTGAEKDKSKTEQWLQHFANYTEFRESSDSEKLRLFRLLLTDKAQDWLMSLPPTTTNNFQLLMTAFRTRFAPSEIHRCQQAAELWSKQQGDNQSVDKYATDIINVAKQIPITDEKLLQFALIKGLRADIELHVLQAGGQTLEKVLTAARIAEAALSTTKPHNEVAKLTAEVQALLQQLKVKETATPITQMVNVVDSPNRAKSPVRQVRFSDRSDVDFTPEQRSSPEPYGDHRAGGRFASERPPRSGTSASDLNSSWRARQRQQQQFQPSTAACSKCGQYHAPLACKAQGQQCRFCGRFNHFERVCFAKASRSFSRPRAYYQSQQH
jgi:hypothetical protein